MKNHITALTLLCMMQVQCPATVHAQDQPAPDERAKPDKIYRSKGADVPRGYVIGRALAAYTSALPTAFEQDLTGLTATGRWLDIGAGEGQAILDYYGPASAPAAAHTNQANRANKAQSIAISIEDRRTPRWHQTAAELEAGKIRYHFGKSLNDYTLQDLGQFDVITDLLGGFSYTRDIAKFMEKTLSLLHVDGSFYSLLQDVQAETGANLPFYRDRGETYLTEIISADKTPVKVCTWLKHISCVEVSCELRPDWKPPVEIYRVRKSCDRVHVPALTPTRYTAGTPPERRYQYTAPETIENTQ